MALLNNNLSVQEADSVPAVLTTAATFKGEIVLLCFHSISFKVKAIESVEICDVLTIG